MGSWNQLGARFWVLIGATFLGFLGIGTVLPLIGPHVRHELGGSDQTVGLVIGVFSFVALASRLISGPLADRRGRKIVFLVGLSSCAASGAIYLLPIGIAGAYLGRTLQGLGEACLYTGAAAWAVEVAGIHRSGEALGYLSSGIWGGISLGPAIGQWLGSFEHAALAQFIAALAAMAIVSRIPEEYETGGAQPAARMDSKVACTYRYCGGTGKRAVSGGHGLSRFAPGAIRECRTRCILRLRIADSALAILFGRTAGPH